MNGRSKQGGAMLVLLVFASACARQVPEAAPPAAPLRVCADPNNLPFSNQRLEGFENKLAVLLAQELQTTVEYTWWAQRRGFIRNTLNARQCDVLLGVPHQLELVQTSQPYYRSSYVFVVRADSPLKLRTFAEAELKRLRIGVQLIGDDGANSPPVHALTRRGLARNLVGYTVYGDYREENPPARIIEAVANGEVDLAIAWGPLAGYFARRQRVPLTVVPVRQRAAQETLPMSFDISLGVRRGERELLHRLEAALERRRAEVRRLLTEYGVPQIEDQKQVAWRQQ
jgi:mxaJ protein